MVGTRGVVCEAQSVPKMNEIRRIGFYPSPRLGKSWQQLRLEQEIGMMIIRPRRQQARQNVL
jgi:hypothetical protein